MGSRNVLLETNYDLWAIIRVMGPLLYSINLTGRTQMNWIEFYWIRVLMSLIISPLGNPSPCIINRALLAYFDIHNTSKNSYLSQREKSVFVL